MLNNRWHEIHNSDRQPILDIPRGDDNRYENPFRDDPAMAGARGSTDARLVDFCNKCCMYGHKIDACPLWVHYWLYNPRTLNNGGFGYTRGVKPKGHAKLENPLDIPWPGHGSSRSVPIGSGPVDTNLPVYTPGVASSSGVERGTGSGPVTAADPSAPAPASTVQSPRGGQHGGAPIGAAPSGGGGTGYALPVDLREMDPAQQEAANRAYAEFVAQGEARRAAKGKQKGGRKGGKFQDLGPARLPVLFCYRCGQEGHGAASCTVPADQLPPLPDPGQEGDTAQGGKRGAGPVGKGGKPKGLGPGRLPMITCYRCGERGHTAAVCDVPDDQLPQGAGKGPGKFGKGGWWSFAGKKGGKEGKGKGKKK